ncbi:MAG: ABC transporter ATP-binding protein [Lachnospiraceae bacterium]|nr:ABC transporter ATP-binding protein [Lachnospiraceae bacterium]
MIKTAWKEKPVLFVSYLGLFFAEFVNSIKKVLLPKFLIDELMLVMNGTPVSAHMNKIVLYTALIIVIEFGASVLSSCMRRIKVSLNEWFNGYFEVTIAGQAMGMDYEHTENPDALDRLNKAKEGISWYSGGVVGILDSLYQMILNAAVLMSVSVIIFIKCPLLIPLQLAALIVMSFYNAKNNKIQEENFLKLAKSNRVFGYILFRIVNFKYGKDIRLYDSSGMMHRKAQELTNEMVEGWRNEAVKTGRNWLKINFANSLRDAISYFYIGYLAVKKIISVGDFTMCISSSSEMYWSIHRIISFGMDIRKRCNYAYQFLLFLEYPAAMETGDKPVKSGEHVIEFKDVSFRYPRCGEYALKHVNIKIKAGEHLSVVGLNGAGKTTFIKLLCRLYDVTDGEICIDGINIMDYSDEEYRKLFAVVFQDFQLFAFSLRENITFGEQSEDEEVERVLRQSGFYDDAVELEKGLDTIIYKSFDEGGVELSGGQQQKTAISRALYRNAPIVILDEPTAALDPLAEHDIYSRFNSLMDGRTAIYISHRLSSCRFCDHIAVFADNTVKEYGTHDELLEMEDGIYANMFKTQAKHYESA